MNNIGPFPKILPSFPANRLTSWELNSNFDCYLVPNGKPVVIVVSLGRVNIYTDTNEVNLDIFDISEDYSLAIRDFISAARKLPRQLAFYGKVCYPSANINIDRSIPYLYLLRCYDVVDNSFLSSESIRSLVGKSNCEGITKRPLEYNSLLELYEQTDRLRAMEQGTDIFCIEKKNPSNVYWLGNN